MKKKNLFAALTAIAALNPEGFTVDANTLQPVTAGYCVACKETQNSFGPAGLEKVIDFVTSTAGVNAYGGWYDNESGFFYWDGTIVLQDKNEAIRLGRANGQIAIFDLNNLEEIRL